ncbi:amino acid ABC transporter substrate-binding protein [Halomonas sp. PR-M31]|uniref:amino acid ABC transporter substrate-binding protein n=1 Tax=Halomonas sp. PR-M31 TaxID=1471202 RepID=UPI000651F1C5|nr:amino acid ABC transporter substrate-binding protein [Halomonas sp. PR-M31]
MKITRLGTLFTAAVIGLSTIGTVGAQEFGPTLSKIKQSGVITIGHRETSVPFSYIGDDQQPVGYTIDICMQIVDEIKSEIGVDELNIRWVPVTPQTRIPLMTNGTLNLECGSTTNNLTRQQQVDYAAITYITGTKLLTKKGSGIVTVEDLSGKPIALAQGTTNERVVKTAIQELGIQDVNVVSVRDHAEGFLALQTDRVDAYSTDDILLYGLIAKARDPDTYEVVGDFLSYDPYAIMLPQNDSKFRLVVNRRLAALFRTGEIETIYSEWFEPMGVPMSDLLRANFRINALPK